MLIVPLKSVPNQTVTTSLAGQTTQIDVRQKLFGVFIDLYVSNVLIIAGALCLDRNPLVRSIYLGFTGDLAFFDTQGTSDPSYGGIGSRWLLAYLAPSEFMGYLGAG